MLSDFGKMIVEGYLSPRQSVRRMLDGGYGLDVAVLLFLLGYLFGAIFEVAMGLAPEGNRIGMHVANLVSSGIALAAMTFLACRLGRVSGGTAEMSEMFLVICWHAFVTSLLWPLIFGLRQQLQAVADAAQQQAAGEAVTEVPEIGTGMVFIGMFAVMLSIWLLASYIAEAHGFKNTWGVLGVIVGLPVLITFLIMTVAGGMSA